MVLTLQRLKWMQSECCRGGEYYCLMLLQTINEKLYCSIKSINKGSARTSFNLLPSIRLDVTSATRQPGRHVFLINKRHPETEHLMAHLENEERVFNWPENAKQVVQIPPKTNPTDCFLFSFVKLFSWCTSSPLFL